MQMRLWTVLSSQTYSSIEKHWICGLPMKRDAPPSNLASPSSPGPTFPSVSPFGLLQPSAVWRPSSALSPDYYGAKEMVLLLSGRLLFPYFPTLKTSVKFNFVLQAPSGSRPLTSFPRYLKAVFGALRQPWAAPYDGFIRARAALHPNHVFLLSFSFPDGVLEASQALRPWQSHDKQ